MVGGHWHIRIFQEDAQGVFPIDFRMLAAPERAALF
jgi:hypothetical protein